LILAHSTSSYPCKAEELNLRMIYTLQEKFNIPVGYSGHEVGLQSTYAAVALGAAFVERTSRSTAPCGAAIRPRLSNPAV
jgi:sialic acid synthase SpsE